jgi:hypothetical protein
MMIERVRRKAPAGQPHFVALFIIMDEFSNFRTLAVAFPDQINPAFNFRRDGHQVHRV